MDAQVKVKPKLKIIRKEEIPHLLAPGEMGAVLELTVKDKNDKVTDHRIMRSESYVRQFLELLWVQFNMLPEKAATPIRDIANAMQNVSIEEHHMEGNGGAGDITNGIIVGTGTTAPTIDDYKIETIIPHGAVAGQLQYSATVIAAATHDATTSQVTITRDFANGSGGAITVNEIAYYVEGNDSANDFMIIRDVIGGGILVPDGQTLTVNYREQAIV